MMLHLYDRATMAYALTLDLDPELHRLLTERIASLRTDKYDLTDDTEFIVIQPGDSEDDLIQHVGFTPLTEPIDGVRFGSPDFNPFWDWLIGHPGWWEMSVSFGSTFAYILFIQHADGIEPDLAAMCAHYTQ